MTRLMKGLLGLSLVAMISLPAGLAAADAGEDVYVKKCTSCHGKDGKGQTPKGKKLGARDLSDPSVQNKSDKDLEDTVLHGSANLMMPGLHGNVTPEEAKAVVKFIRTFKK